MLHSKHAQSMIDSYLLSPIARTVKATLRWTVARGWLAPMTILSAVVGLYVLYLLFISHSGFWDFEGYVAAVKAMKIGKSPYDVPFIWRNFGNGTVYFVYPPLIAEVFYKISDVALTPAGLTILFTVSVASTLAIPYLLADCPKRWYSAEFLSVCGLYFALYGLGGLRLVASGNIQPILCVTIIVSIVIAIRFQNYKYFWIALAFCSFFKFYFLAFLLVPLILDKKYTASIVFVVLFGTIYSTNYFFNPELFRQFTAIVQMASLETQNAGFSLYSLVVAALGAGFESNIRIVAIALGIHFIFVVFIFGLAYAVAAKRVRPLSFDLLACWILMSAYFVSPRLIEYDMAILVVPFVRLGRALMIDRGVGLGVASIIAIGGLILIRTPFVPWVGTFAFIGVWLGTAVEWLGVNTAQYHRKRALDGA